LFPYCTSVNEKRIVLRKIVQVLLAEAIVLSMIHLRFHGIDSIGRAFTAAVSVLLVLRARPWPTERGAVWKRRT